ncbi:hypothetical protein CDAR_418751 [Caerostris darwini]|uniref:Uncharacterized protein n=1 Tax=Caerostris darwini TaxID=1538125 RepID=A0AAV4MVB3_9ARAC|nr:hypothetical protein CDAR_418751 [Caerostris darwini]
MPPLISLETEQCEGPDLHRKGPELSRPHRILTDSHPMQLLLQREHRERVNPSFFCLSGWNSEWTLFLECSRNKTHLNDSPFNRKTTPNRAPKLNLCENPISATTNAAANLFGDPTMPGARLTPKGPGAQQASEDSHPMQLLLQRERVNPSFFRLSGWNFEWKLFLECSRSISGREMCPWHYINQTFT